jgi:ComF family protein
MMPKWLSTVPQIAGWPRALPLAALLDLLFPPQCAACGAPCEPEIGGPHLCPPCSACLKISAEPRCPGCALRCSIADLPLRRCAACRGRKWLFSAARTIGTHEKDLRQAVLKAKHAFYEPLAIALGRRLASVIETMPFPEPPDVVVPVPMHWLRRLWRKTHPAGTIARAVACDLRLPVVSHALVCRRLLRQQTSLTAAERRKNVRGAFFVRRKRAIAGRRILLVDDVMTTGATAREASRMLLQAGAKCVFVATLARSTPDF